MHVARSFLSLWTKGPAITAQATRPQDSRTRAGALPLDFFILAAGVAPLGVQVAAPHFCSAPAYDLPPLTLSREDQVK